MTLATHAIVGAMAAELVPSHPVIGFILGFVSHLAIDSLPHYDYHLSSVVPAPDRDFRKINIVLHWRFLADLIPMGLDCIGGFLIAGALFAAGPQILATAILGAMAGVLPDFLQFVYYKTHAPFLFHLQRLHAALQARNAFNKRPLPGLAIQVAVILVLGSALRLMGRL